MLNKVTLIGNLGADPEIRVQDNGIKFARLRVATTERIYLRDSGTTREHTEWHTVVAWRSLAELADKYLLKGSQVYVEGALRHREWTDKQEVKHAAVDIVASELKILSRAAKPSDGVTPAQVADIDDAMAGKIPF